jgi:hypothetical protein
MSDSDEIELTSSTCVMILYTLIIRPCVWRWCPTLSEEHSQLLCCPGLSKIALHCCRCHARAIEVKVRGAERLVCMRIMITIKRNDMTEVLYIIGAYSSLWFLSPTPLCFHKFHVIGGVFTWIKNMNFPAETFIWSRYCRFRRWRSA